LSDGGGLRSKLNFPNSKVNRGYVGKAPPLKKNNTTGFRGVYGPTPDGKYSAKTSVDGISKYLGMHNTKEEAARAYDRAIIENNCDIELLNFPNEHPSALSTGANGKMDSSAYIILTKSNFSLLFYIYISVTLHTIVILTNGTIDGWYVFPNAALNSDQADEFSTDAVQGAQVVVVRNGLVETFSSQASILQLVVGNVTFSRAAASYWNGGVSLAGFATTVQAYAFDRTSRTSSAAWVYKGNF
jgi:hypothetical protein